MVEDDKQLTDSQAVQHEMVEQARALPGVAEVIDLYGRLSAYARFVNVQHSRVRNATGGNAV